MKQKGNLLLHLNAFNPRLETLKPGCGHSNESYSQGGALYLLCTRCGHSSKSSWVILLYSALHFAVWGGSNCSVRKKNFSNVKLSSSTFLWCCLPTFHKIIFFNFLGFEIGWLWGWKSSTNNFSERMVESWLLIWSTGSFISHPYYDWKKWDTKGKDGKFQFQF